MLALAVQHNTGRPLPTCTRRVVKYAMADSSSERWRATVPGEAAQAFLCDPTPPASLFVGDGAFVAYAALRLHRFDLSTGVHLAEVRTRHQPVSGLAQHAGHLYVATDSRLFELESTDLSIVRQWERGLVRYTMQLLPARTTLAMANWRMPSIGLFDLNTGRTRRVNVGLQPLLVRHGGAIKVLAGFEGGMWTLDIVRIRLTDAERTPPVVAIASGTDLWGLLAGPAEHRGGTPSALVKRGSNEVLRLTGEPWSITLDGECSTLVCDDVSGVLWCVIRHGRGYSAAGHIPNDRPGRWHPYSGGGIQLCARRRRRARGPGYEVAPGGRRQSDCVEHVDARLLQPWP
jgi:hypothetical protein